MITEEINEEYTEAQWSAETQTTPLFIPQIDGSWRALAVNLPCPKCKKVGFYAPIKFPPEASEDKIIRKYRACKFCGFWQDVPGYPGTRNEGRPFYCIPLRCMNPKCRTFNYTKENLDKPCEVKGCGTKCELSKWPIDDPNHEYHRYKLYQLS